MPTVNDILAYLSEIAPVSLAEEWDNVGLLCGDETAPVKSALIALDITKAVAREAASKGAALVVSHHPVIFDPLRTVTAQGPGAVVWELAAHSVSAVCMHTNLDISKQGVNSALADKLCLKNTRPLEKIGEALAGDYGLGLVGESGVRGGLDEFAAFAAAKLGCGCVRVCPAQKSAKLIAVCGGAEDGNLVECALKEGADTLLVGEIKHHRVIEALEKGLNIIEAGHFATENVVCPCLVQLLSEKFPTVSFELAQSARSPCYGVTAGGKI